MNLEKLKIKAQNLRKKNFPGIFKERGGAFRGQFFNDRSISFIV